MEPKRLHDPDRRRRQLENHAADNHGGRPLQNRHHSRERHENAEKRPAGRSLALRRTVEHGRQFPGTRQSARRRCRRRNSGFGLSRPAPVPCEARLQPTAPTRLPGKLDSLVARIGRNVQRHRLPLRPHAPPAGEGARRHDRMRMGRLRSRSMDEPRKPDALRRSPVPRIRRPADRQRHPDRPVQRHAAAHKRLHDQRVHLLSGRSQHHRPGGLPHAVPGHGRRVARTLG